MSKSRETQIAEGLNPAATIEASVRVLPVRRRVRVPFLRQIEGLGSPQKFKLTKPEMVIGRDEKSDIPLLSANVSRRHAMIRCRPLAVTICDFESRNGVYLNGMKVHSAVLREGDIIQVADVLFEFFED